MKKEKRKRKKNYKIYLIVSTSLFSLILRANSFAYKDDRHIDGLKIYHIEIIVYDDP